MGQEFFLEVATWHEMCGSVFVGQYDSWRGGGAMGTGLELN